MRACLHAWKNGVKIHVRGGFTIHRRSSRFGTPYPFDMIVQNLNSPLLKVRFPSAFLHCVGVCNIYIKLTTTAVNMPGSFLICISARETNTSSRAKLVVSKFTLLQVIQVMQVNYSGVFFYIPS